MYRHHPQTALARRLLAEGAIGPLAYMRAALTVTAPPGDIRRTGHLGGGAVIDLGCYCISAVRLFAGEPARVYAEQVVDGAESADGSDLRLAGTMRVRNDVLAQFDVGLDYPRRDELELIGTAGKITVPDPWLCRPGYLEVERDGKTERLAVGPSGGLALGPEEDDVYRIEMEVASAAIADGTPTAFGRQDAINQAAVIEAVRHSARQGRPLDLT
jgi:predicted dehydrogenase